MKMMVMLITFIVSTSCSNHDNSITDKSQITGKWILVGQLVDPGDGSGKFQDIISEKSIEIFPDSTILCNRDLCSINDNISQSTKGVFNANFEITSKQCPNISALKMELSRSDLIIYHPCIEPCAEKYKRVD